MQIDFQLKVSSHFRCLIVLSRSACRDLREAPEHPLELVRLPKQERSASNREALSSTSEAAEPITQSEATERIVNCEL